MAEEMIFGANAHLRSKGRIELQSAGRTYLLLLQLFSGLVRHNKKNYSIRQLRSCCKMYGDMKMSSIFYVLFKTQINCDSTKFNSKSC